MQATGLSSNILLQAVYVLAIRTGIMVPYALMVPSQQDMFHGGGTVLKSIQQGLALQPTKIQTLA